MTSHACDSSELIQLRREHAAGQLLPALQSNPSETVSKQRYGFTDVRSSTQQLNKWIPTAAIRFIFAIRLKAKLRRINSLGLPRRSGRKSWKFRRGSCEIRLAWQILPVSVPTTRLILRGKQKKEKRKKEKKRIEKGGKKIDGRRSGTLIRVIGNPVASGRSRLSGGHDISIRKQWKRFTAFFSPGAYTRVPRGYARKTVIPEWAGGDDGDRGWKRAFETDASGSGHGTNDARVYFDKIGWQEAFYLALWWTIFSWRLYARSRETLWSVLIYSPYNLTERAREVVKLSLLISFYDALLIFQGGKLNFISSIPREREDYEPIRLD